MTGDELMLPNASSGRPGQVIADSGCRTAVAGELWHRHLQKHLDELGVRYIKVQENEVFQFGSGGPEVSRMTVLYPVNLGQGRWDAVRMSVVTGSASRCPGLVGPSELALWKVQFDFARKEIKIDQKAQPMLLTSTRHPGLDICAFDCLPGCDPWTLEHMEELYKMLVYNPQTLAFVADKAEDTSEDETSQDEPGQDPDQDPRFVDQSNDS